MNPEPRRRKKEPKGYRSMPVTLQVSIPAIGLLLAGVALSGPIEDLWNWFMPDYGRIAFLDAKGAPVGSGVVELFAYDQSMTGPSPAKKIGELNFEAGKVVEIPEELLSDKALVRVTVPGFGVDFRTVYLERPVIELKLAPPVVMEGTVMSVAGGPLAGVRIQAIGGEARGVPLEEVRSDKDGNFRLTKISGNRRNVLVRARMDGFVIDERDHWRGLPDNAPAENRELHFVLTPVPPAEGRIQLPKSLGEGFDPSTLEVRVYQFPGLDTQVGKDASFALRNMPAKYLCRLVVGGLPPGYTHDLANGEAGSGDIDVRVWEAVDVVGFVVDGSTGSGLQGAEVWHEYGPRIFTRVRSGADGSFTLPGLPKRSKVRVHAVNSQGRREFRELDLSNGSKKVLRIEFD